jgi:hypothetical protein
VGTIVGELRAVFGLFGAIFGVRRRHTILLERRRQLDEVLREAVANLGGIRLVWSEEHNRLDWRAWLHGDLLRTRAWREHKVALMTRVDGGPAIRDEIAADLDALYTELDDAARGSHSFSSDWEVRLVDIGTRLREDVARYPRRHWDRVAIGRAPVVVLPELDARIRTPSSPAELQQRALDRLRSDQGDL